jgi:hypothetical protein
MLSPTHRNSAATPQVLSRPPVLSCVFATFLVQMLCAQDGAALYRRFCGGCHEPGSADRAPARPYLAECRPNRLLLPSKAALCLIRHDRFPRFNVML